MAEGRSAGPEAEAFRTVYMQQSRMAQNDVKAIYRETLESLGQSRLAIAVNDEVAQFGAALKPGLGDNNAVTELVFYKGVFDDMSARMTNNARAELEIKADLKAAGHSDAEVDLIYSGIRKASARNKQMLDAFKKDMIDHGLMDPKLDKGDAYGLPVVYSRSAINEDPQGFEDMLIRLLAKQPSDEFVDDYLKTLVERGADGTEKPLFKDAEALKKDEKAWAEAVRLWSDESHRATADAAEAAYASAQVKFASKLDEMDMIVDGIEGLKKDKRIATLTEARAASASAEANLHARTLASATRSAERAEAKVRDIETRLGDADAAYRSLTEDMARGGDQIDAAGAAVRQAEREAGTAQSTVDFLRGEKAPELAGRAEAQASGTWQGKRDAAYHQEQITRLNGELAEARKLRDETTATLKAAKDEFEAIAKQQRNTERWVDAVRKEVDTLLKHEDEALLAPGFRDRLKGDADRVALLKEKLAAATAEKKAIHDNLTLAYQGKKLTAAELRAAANEVRKTGRLNKRMQNATPLTKFVREVTTALRGQDRYPGGMLMDNVAETGRVKERSFNWTSDLWAEMARKGFVETDTQALLDRYARDVGGRLAVQRSMGTQNIDEILTAARDWYDDRARATSDPKAVKKILAARDANLKDLRASYDRLMGKHEINDDSAVGWLAAKLGQMGYLRFGGGFGLAALGDLGTAVFSQKGFLKGIAQHTGAYKELVELAKGNEGSRQLLALLQSFETGAHMQTSPRALGSKTARDHLGFGSGAVRDATVMTDRLLNVLGNKVNVLSGLAAISDGTRRIAGFVQIANMQRWLDKGLAADGKSFDYQKLTRQQRHDLASLNIGEREAAQMAKLFRKHGTQHDKLFDPGLAGWATEPNGDAMIGLFNTAMVKAQQRASYTQGFGNMPLMMDGPIGKLLFQFQSQAFQFTNNFLIAGAQRGALDESFMRMATALGVSVAMATLVTVARNQMRAQPEDLSKWDASKWGWTLVQRTGILGWSGQYVDSFNKLAGDSINNALGVKVIDPGSKFSQNDWLASLVGPWKGVLDNVGATGSSLVHGEFSKAHEKAFQLVPLNQQMQVLRHAAAVIAN